MTYPGQNPSRQGRSLKPAGLCQRWGCLLPVGPSSTFGPGPACMVCSLNLRPTAFPKHLGAPSETTDPAAPAAPPRPNQYCPRKDACLREEVLPPKRRGPKVAL